MGCAMSESSVIKSDSGLHPETCSHCERVIVSELSCCPFHYEDKEQIEGMDDAAARERRITAALYMIRELPTEDIEWVNEVFPHLVECAYTELLNPEGKTV